MRNVLTRVIALAILLAPAQPAQAIRPSAPSYAPDVILTHDETFTTYANKASTAQTEWNIWDNHLQLQPYEGYFSRMTDPATAADANGNIVVVWHDERNGGNDIDIYAQKLDANGNRLWQEDVRVNSDSNTPADQTQPAVAVDASGNAFVVWTDTRNAATTGDDVYAQKLDANGNKQWANDVRVNSDTTAYGQNAPAIATTGNEAIVVWADDRGFQGISGSNLDIYAQRLNSSGAKQWAASDVRVNSTTATGQQDMPDISVGSAGNAYVVWQDGRSGDFSGDIYAQKLSTSGARLWNTNDVWVDGGNNGTSQSAPKVAMGQSVVFVGWRDGRNAGTTADDIYAQSLADNTGSRLWANDVRVNASTDFGNDFDLDLATDGSNAILSWVFFNGTESDAFAQKLNAQGTKQWGAADLLVSNGNNKDQDSTSVTVDSSGNAFVVWDDHRKGNNIFAQKLNSSGAKQWNASDVRVDTQQGPVSQFAPAVGLDGNGDAFVAWADSRYGRSNIYIRKLAANGTRLWNNDVRINLGSIGDARAVALVVDPSNNAVLAWEDTRNGDTNPDVYVQKIDTNGNRLWLSDVKVNADTGSTRQTQPALASDGSGNMVVAWQDERNGNTNADIYAQKLSSSGVTQWASDVRVNSDAGTTQQLSPAVAVDASGNAIVAWQDQRTSATSSDDIFAQKLNASGAKQWNANDVRVQADATNISQRSPKIAQDGAAVFVAWTDYRAGGFNSDVYAQRLGSNTGSRQWASDVRVNSDAGTTSQYLGGVAANGSGNAVVVWEDSRNTLSFSTNTDVYAQKLNSTGSKQWLASDVPVNAQTNIAAQVKPAVAMHTDGSAEFAWEDYRNLNADIYAQRFNSVGAPPASGDVALIEIDRFYYLTGTAESKTIDTLNANIVAATLNANVSANGGAVQFYLSNNGGGDWVAAELGVAQVFSSTGSDLRWRAVLNADPIRPRTPFVANVHIEYTDVLPNADAYENDDACTQARTISLNGETQAHTFHAAADVDWAKFDVISGTTYVLQTSNAQANADTALEVYAACPQPAFANGGNTFGSDARITFKANFSGPVLAKVSNDNTSGISTSTGYSLSVRSATQLPVAIIVAGRNNGNTVRENIDFAADTAYRTLLGAGLSKANIRYFSPNPNRDVDGNGNATDDIAGPPVPANVRAAVQDWARERGVGLGVPFYLYMMDHGGVDTFFADGDAGTIKADELNLWLSNLEATSGADNVNVIIEACRSGSFLNVTGAGPGKISGRNRVVIVSTSDDKDAFASPRGAYFSDMFWTAIDENRDLKTAFERGQQAVAAVGVSQTPWLDDNGDGVFNAQDGALARSRGLGGAFAGVPPVIDALSASGTISGTGNISVRARDDLGVNQVRVEIFAPGFVPPAPSADSSTRPLDVPVQTLSAAGNGTFAISYSGFAITGTYKLIAYAVDNDGNQSLPFVSSVTIGSGQNHKVFLPLLRR